MFVGRITVFSFITTPSELRSLADDLEQRAKSVKCGENLVVSTITTNDGDEIKFVLDQGRVMSHGS